MSLEIIKRQFDSEHVRRLKEATTEAQVGQVLAIVMEEGLAQVYLVSNGNCRQRAKVDLHIPKKKAIDKGHVKKKTKFHDQIESALD